MLMVLDLERICLFFLFDRPSFNILLFFKLAFYTKDKTNAGGGWGFGVQWRVRVDSGQLNLGRIASSLFPLVSSLVLFKGPATTGLIG